VLQVPTNLTVKFDLSVDGCYIAAAVTQGQRLGGAKLTFNGRGWVSWRTLGISSKIKVDSNVKKRSIDKSKT